MAAAYIALGLSLAGGLILLAVVFTGKSRDQALERRVSRMVKAPPIAIEGAAAITSASTPPICWPWGALLRSG
jgi:hypothetical protein